MTDQNPQGSADRSGTGDGARPGPQQPGSQQSGSQQPAPGPGPQQPYGAPAAPLTAEQDRQWAMWAHIGGILNFIPPLVIWLVFRERGRFTDQEAKESLNFQITMAIVWIAWSIISGVLGAVLGFIPIIGWLITGLVFGLVWLALVVVQIVFPILGGVTVNNGRPYRYPVNLRLIR